MSQVHPHAIAYFDQPVIETTISVEMPVALRRPVSTGQSRTNKGGASTDYFLEGPYWDAYGNFWLVDIPYGRVLRVFLQGDQGVVVECNGESSGLALRHDGTLLIADYKNGLLSLDLVAGAVMPFLTRRNSERFKDPNDLIVARNGGVCFTDQGQADLYDPIGRVHRLCTGDRFDCLLTNGPGPSDLVLTPDESTLFTVMTRDNTAWRSPLPVDGGTSKAGRFAQFYGTSGPDGMAIGAAGHLFVARASLGAVFVVSSHGGPLVRIASCHGCTTANVALTSDGQSLVVIESAMGTVLCARWTPPRRG